MAVQTIGDLAQGLILRRQSNVLKQQVETLSQELSSGLTSDVTQHLSGNLVQLADVEHKLQVLESYRTSAQRGGTESGVMQTALERIQTETEALAGSALTFGTSVGAAGIDVFAQEARGALGALVSALNTHVGGRALFAGANVTDLPLASTEDFIAALGTAVSGAATMADLTTAMDVFFDTPGGGFETLIYQGGIAPRAAYPLGEGESVTLDLRADDPSIRTVLKQVAISAVLDDPGITLSETDRFALAGQAGEALLGAQTRFTDIRADLGFAEERIDRAASRLSAEISGLNMMRTELLAVDPFETATELETVQLRLETLYTITARTSRLSLVNFLS